MSSADEMLVFVRVVSLGSFTGAAESLSVPKSTVSRQVARLEERLGVRLLHAMQLSVKREVLHCSALDACSVFCAHQRQRHFHSGGCWRAPTVKQPDQVAMGIPNVVAASARHGARSVGAGGGRRGPQGARQAVAMRDRIGDTEMETQK